jgi:hypothetical protein
MTTRKLTFSTETAEYCGRICKKEIYLHIDHTTILPFDNIDDLKKFAQDILNMLPEIKEGL